MLVPCIQGLFRLFLNYCISTTLAHLLLYAAPLFLTLNTGFQYSFVKYLLKYIFIYIIM